MADPKTSWIPPLAGSTPMDKYRQHINSKFVKSLRNIKELQVWSVESPQDFWIDLYSYLDIVPALPAEIKKAYDDTLPMSSIPKFFEGLRMNYAENALFANPDPNALALIGVREDDDLTKADGERTTWSELRERVRKVASALKRHGIKEGDRVGALVSNSIWAVVLFLASASIGAIFTSINPDLGVEGCVSRLLQVTPKILFADSDITYRGKRQALASKVRQIIARLKLKPRVFMISLRLPVAHYPSMDEFLAKADPTDALLFNRVSFSHPLVICYSSGTTGAPKCIVHQHGLILQLRKVSRLQNSLTTKDVIVQYSSTTWVMFYIMNGHLATGATCVCYDGSPMHPDVRRMLQLCEKYRSPRYLVELEICKVKPKQEFDLSTLRMVNTTGAPLSLDQYDWFYASFPKMVHLSNTAGGTDTASSMIASDPSGPLYKGEMQMVSIGIDLDIADPETGESIKDTGRAGEMVIRKPFPSMPVCFWGDRDDKIYRFSYFERFDKVDVWAQHDWLSCNPKTGGFVMTGRSDGVLNPSGIRFGSGEIYGIVEGPAFNSEIAETLCVGRRRAQDTDEAVFLFVKMLPGHAFTEETRENLRDAIATGLSPRHVPAFILQVDDIPVTINGKKVETATKSLISGREVAISTTVANPDTLRGYSRYRDLERPPRASKM